METGGRRTWRPEDDGQEEEEAARGSTCLRWGPHNEQQQQQEEGEAGGGGTWSGELLSPSLSPLSPGGARTPEDGEEEEGGREV